ncbi:MAG: T9SS type A sorting domain-containing protein [Bacteroidia bacterium]|nr:T9SS type A sorting domain-containing protein [Bacteroidia bacterium]
MKKLFYAICLILLINNSTKGQTYVTIPDSNFVAWLSYNIPSAMNGNQLNTSDSLVVSLSYMNVSSDTIYDLTGIEHFTGLQYLNCSNNRLTFLPVVANSIQTLDISFNNIDSLLQLPDSLRYFSCGQNSIDTLPNFPALIKTIDCHNNYLTILPNLTDSLTNIDCSGNQLTLLPTLPDSLTTLDCSENWLNSLPTLPLGLVTLDCHHNNLNTLPTLPNTIIQINCLQNSITTLPTLPTSLITLDCAYNQLSSLPPLPNNLMTLTCGGNQLSALPVLPNSLTSLKCYSNQLSVLPTLPNGLFYLDCNHNPLSAGLPTLPNSIVYLDCSYDQLTILPTLPSTLGALNCGSNSLNTLPSLPNSLGSLYCNSNPLDSLPTLPSQLNILHCSYATLDSLPQLPTFLNTLYCTSNQLTSLPALPNSLTTLFCDNNQITALPTLPYSIYRLHCENNAISCFSVFPFSLQWLTFYNNPFTCIPNYLPVMDSVTLNYPLCMTNDPVGNPNACPSAEGIVGFSYSDDNSNCSNDTTDIKLKNIPIKLLDNNGNLISQTYTAINGVYNFPEPAGTYTVYVDTLGIPANNTCPNPGIDSTVTTSISNPLVSDVNFDFTCKPGFDVGVRSILRCGLVFPGQTHNLRFVAGDMSQWFNLRCASGISGTVQITVNGPVSFNGIAGNALTPTITGNTYTYSINDFAAINCSTAFGLMLDVDTTAGSGSPICVTINVNGVGADNDLTNNTMTYCYEVVNSHDPNNKETYPKAVPQHYQDWLTYTINFQNTGNAPAINIRLEDTLDSNLDISTFQVTNYSHYNTTTVNGNILTVRFPNIMLADSTTSADSSKGFIQYRIKPLPNRPAETVVYNTAYIYFDYNTPIITNTTTNIFKGSAVSISEYEQYNSFNIYPNPASSTIIVNTKNTEEISNIEIYDISGRIIKTLQEDASKETKIVLNDIEKGIYFISITDGKRSQTKKFIKQ